MDADYSSALTLLLRYPEPKAPHGPPTFVDDALYLQANLTRGAGSSLITKYSGKAPVIKHGEQPYIVNHVNSKERTASRRARPSRSSKDHPSPGGSPARFLQQQRGLENLFQDVSGGLQRRSEAWGIAKTVRGAVSEVKKNVQVLQSGSSSPRPSMEITRDAAHEVIHPALPDVKELAGRIKVLEDRNKALAKMLGNALENLRSGNASENSDTNKDSAKLLEAVARIQFVQVYLENSSIDIPPEETEDHLEKASEHNPSESEKASIDSPSPKPTPSPAPSAQKREPPTRKARTEDLSPALQPSPFHHPRPALTQSSFSWMLGEDRRQSSFVTSSLLAPDERRNSDTKGRPAHLFGDNKGEEGKKDEDVGDDGFTLESLKGTNARR
jgi:TBC1 domain family member 5